jgi:SAM-dependent methyltransferase
MDNSPSTNDEQVTMWNGPSGRAWVEAQDLLDRAFKPFEDLLVAAVAARSPRQLLDVGCGTGATTLAAARLLGRSARCIGVDISEPMLALARARAERDGLAATFIRGDAQVHPFEETSLDMIVSRFGVMFFDDPVQAFANLRRAARDGAALSFIAWRSATENPFMTTAERAAAPLLPDLPARRPGGPGQFAFASGARVSSILAASGWSDVDVRPIDVECRFPENELVSYLTRLGPVGRIVQEADERTRAAIVDTIRPAFDAFVHGADVRFTAACWLATARATSRAGTIA